MPDPESQKRYYDELVRTRRKTRYGLSCGFEDRFDPALVDRRPLLARAMAAMLDQCLPPKIGTLIDLGCGTAHYWPLLASRCEGLLGCDLSAAMARAGHRYQSESRGAPLGQLLCAEVSRLPVASRSIDVVLSIDTLHHVGDREALLEEIHRILRPGGQVVAVEPNTRNPVVFLAHLLPPEERGALWPNGIGAMARAFRRRFDDVEDRPLTYVSGIEWAPALRLVEAVDPLLRRPPLSALALRRVLVARKERR